MTISIRRTGHLADQHDAAAGRHGATQFVENGSPDGVDRDLGAASAGRVAHAGGEASIGSDDDLVAPRVAQDANLSAVRVAATTKAPVTRAI